MMKTKVAVAISLAGVLAAGTAAALVNTRVLNGGSSSLSADAPATPQTAAAEVVAPASGSEMPVPASVANSPTEATYAVGSSGTVTLDTAGDVLTVAAAAPAAGWTLTQSEIDDGGSNAEVKFQSGSVEVEFHANLLYGVVRTSVESHDLSTTNDSVAENSGFDDQQGSNNTVQGGDDSGHGSDDGEDDDRGGGDD